jgi:sec-independent protein translocase protein TatB
MFDVAPTEFLLVAIVALIVIGPKDLPKAMRFAGYWVGKARGVARQFRSGFDTMVREAELAEMEKKWAEDNARIMREHPLDSTQSALPAPDAGPDAVAETVPETVVATVADSPPVDDVAADDGEAAPVLTAQPEILPSPELPFDQPKAAS